MRDTGNTIRLIVGLGNPGQEYSVTRHNAGFWWLNQLAAHQGVLLKAEGKFHGLAGRATIDGCEVWLLQPQTYMNASGLAVGMLAGFFKITSQQILIVHDELDLLPGVARLKKGGGHGGHNGLKDIMTHLHTPDFWRLRLGIGHPGQRGAVVDYVLKAPRREEAELIEAAMIRGFAVLPSLLRGDFSAAMLKLHTQEGRQKTTSPAETR